MTVPSVISSPLLVLEQLSKRYGRKVVFSDVSHSFRAGMHLLTGGSGSGKSTLLRVIATAEKATAGQLLWNAAAGSSARKQIRTTLGYAPQAVSLPEDLTAREFLQYMAALKGIPTAESETQAVTLCTAVGLGADMDARISAYSGGMRRRLIFTQALLGRPQLVILDEPTAELDLAAQRQVVEALTGLRTSAILLIATHAAEIMEPFASSVLQVSEGRVQAS